MALLSFGSSAQVDTNTQALPLCSSPLVRYSKIPVPCQGPAIINTNENFDIPSERLSFEDIERMFSAESSAGGRPRTRTSPTSTTATTSTQQQQTVPEPTNFGFEFELTCKAKMVTDTNLTMFLLSNANFEISNVNQFKSLYPSDWSMSLSRERSFIPSTLIPLSTTPILNSPTIINMSVVKNYYTQSVSGGLELNVCADSDSSEVVCVISKIFPTQETLKTLMFIENHSTGVKNTLEINCNVEFKY